MSKKIIRYIGIYSCLILGMWSSLLSGTEPIDVVYTWVDGSDPRWQASFAEYSQKERGASDALSKRRFKDHEELRYSLRSIYRFAPWVNHIYIVTCGQKPQWLAPHPKITVVDHKKIFPNPKHLPTFNSMAIECNLHHIPDLSEHYLYFNDDVFLGKRSSPDNFFTKDDKMRIFLSETKMPTGTPIPGDEGFYAASKNTSSLLNEHYGFDHHFCHAHTPYPSLKSFVESTENRFPVIFTTVSSHRFRSLDDYTITNGLVPYAALYTHQGEKSIETRKTVSFGKSPVQDQTALNELFFIRPRFFCIQDSTNDDQTDSAAILHEFFEAYFPEKAPWEKD